MFGKNYIEWVNNCQFEQQVNKIIIKKKNDTNLLLYTKLVTKIPSRIVGPHKRKRPQGSFVLPLLKKELVFGRA